MAATSPGCCEQNKQRSTSARTGSAPARWWRWRLSAGAMASHFRPPTSSGSPGTSGCDTNLRTTPDAMLQLVRSIWSIEGWHWIRDTQLHENAHRYRGNGAGAMSSLRTAALNLLRLAGFQSIRAGMQAVMHDMTALLAMARQRPQPDPC